MTSPVNPTVARLDRIADQLGLALVERSRNGREFEGFGRTFTYRPGGLGIVRVTAFVGGKPDTIAHRTVPQMEALFTRVLIWVAEQEPDLSTAFEGTGGNLRPTGVESVEHPINDVTPTEEQS